MKLIPPFFLFLLVGIPAIYAAEPEAHPEEVNAKSEPQGAEEAVLTQAPHVPPPITRKHPATVTVKLEVIEKVKRMADGVEYLFWTFGGDVPGNFIRIREGDLVKFHLSNHPTSKMPHNIDLHAVTGSGGGATSSFTAPGHTSIFEFKALNPGLFVYHCATAPVGMHVGNGMYGLILVEPEGGLPKVDREYYVMQGEFYTTGAFGEEGLQPFDQQKALDEKPTYVLFNGAVGSLNGDNALKAKTGETVRLFVGNGGPNLLSSFHVIGEIFDRVYQEAGTALAQRNVQTTLIPAGGAAMVEIETQVPGTFTLVDHSLFRAFNKGALGMLKVEGPENKLVYSGKEVDEIYLGTAASPVSRKIEILEEEKKGAIKGDAKIAGLDKEIMMEKGKRVYAQTCFACHMENGEGMPGIFPPLAKSDFLLADKSRSIQAVMNGLSGPITVNGKEYNGVMPPVGINDEQIAQVLTYVRNSWGNTGDMVTTEDVKRVRAETAGQH